MISFHRAPSASLVRTLSLALVGGGLALTGCGAGEAQPELTRFDSCQTMETWIKASALQQVNYVDPVFGGGFEAPGVPMGEESMGAGGGTAANAPMTDNGAARSSLVGIDGNRTYSSTNVQVDGVDEADFIKNDGDYIFALDNSGLTIIDAWPAEEMSELSRLDVEGQPQSLYFDGVDTVVIFSAIWEGGSPESGADVPRDTVSQWSGAPQTTKLTMVNVSQRSNPRVVRETYLDGSLRTSRRIGDKLHVVLNNALGDNVSAIDTGDSPFYREALRDGINKADISAWMPWVQDNVRSGDSWQSSQAELVKCGDVFRPRTRTELDFTGIVTVDLSDPTAPLETVGALTRADASYATQDSLYLAMTEYDSGAFRSLDGSVDTRIHKFDLGDKVDYAASGKVEGELLNQFSMSEKDGMPRLATTTWSDMGGANASMYVIAPEGEAERKLVAVGAVHDIAPAGESIYAVRFVGDKAYVVTYEQIDPLFTIDLSDPTNPQVRGELEVTGFSNYLHPVEDDYLLAVGEEIDANTWEDRGLQVSLFDVSDLDSPALLDREIIEGGGAWSEAQYDHHAFNYFDALGVLALPTMSWGNYGVEHTSLQLLSVDPAAGIETLGEIDHTDFTDAEDAQYLGSCNQVRRSIFIEDYVYAVSNHGIQVVMLDNPSETVSDLMFDDGGCSDAYYGRGW